MIPGHVRKTRFDFKQKSVRSRIWKDKAWQGPEMCLLALDKGRWKPSGRLPRLGVSSPLGHTLSLSRLIFTSPAHRG